MKMSATVTDTTTRPIEPPNYDALPRAEQVAFHIARIKWEDDHPEIMAAEEAVAKAEAEAVRKAEEAKEAARAAIGRTMERPVAPVRPDNLHDLPEEKQQSFWQVQRAYAAQEALWALGHPAEIEAEQEAEREAEGAQQAAEDAERAIKDAELVALAATKGWSKANPQMKYPVKFAKERIKEANRLAAHIAAIKAEKAARLAKGLAMTRPVKPKNFDDLPEDKKSPYYSDLHIWEEAHPEIVEAEAEAERVADEIIERKAEAEKVKKYPDYPVKPVDFHKLRWQEREVYWAAIKKWDEDHPDVVAAERDAEDAAWRAENPEEAAEQDREQAKDAAKEAAAKARRIAKEAKDPEGYKAASLEDEQDGEIENSGERDEAKQEARESGESWGDIKDEWRDNWINDNWTAELEAQWLVDFEDQWLKDHGQAFPGHGPATKAEPVKAAAPAPVVEAKPVKVEPVSVTVTDAPATSLVPLDVLGKEIVACAKSGDKNLEKAEQLYKAAGLKLIEARTRTDNFKSFLKVECNGLSRARAYELIAIGDGSKTLEQVRDRAAEGMRKTRAKQVGQHGKPDAQTQLFADFKKLVKQATPETRREMLDYLVERQ